ncbi:MAG: helix-turn-helix domain-containing protein, partial [Myxococcota bacterium]
MSGRVLVVGVPKSRGADLQSALWREGLDLVWSGVEDLRDWLAGSAVDALVADLSRSDVRSRLDFERPEVPIVPYDEVPIVVGALKNLLGPAGLALSGSTVDLQTGDATTKDGRKVVLTANEIALLRFLARRRDEVIPESELLRKVWGYAAGVRSRAVASTVYRLRKKVELDPKNPVNLLSEYGRGYRLSMPARP